MKELIAHGSRVRAVTRSSKYGPDSVVVKTYAELTPQSADDILVHLAESRDHSKGGPTDEERAQRETLLSQDWRRIVYASSAAVYGDQISRPRRVSEAIAPRAVYACWKSEGEEIVRKRGGIVARLSNMYGSGMASNNVISDILRQLRETGPVAVRDVTPVRDYIHVDDAAKAMARMTTSGMAGSTYNVGTGLGTSVDEVARAILEIAGQAGRDVRAGRNAAGRPSHLVLDVDATTRALGWRPDISLRVGLQRLVEAGR